MPVAGGPRVAEGEGEVVIDLLEAELVARHVLVEIAAGPEAASVLPVEGFPGDLLALPTDPQDRLAAGVRIALVNPVDGQVRKQRVSGDTRPAVRPPDEETNNQWSALEMTLTKNGGIRSTLRMT